MSAVDWDAVIHELKKPNGWIKDSLGFPEDPDGPVCLLGAFARVSSRSEGLTTLNKVIGEQFPERLPQPTGWYSVVPTFNDHPDTTLDDVILCCEKARAAQGEFS